MNNKNFDIENSSQQNNDDDEFTVQQFSGRLKSMMIFLVILIW